MPGKGKNRIVLAPQTRLAGVEHLAPRFFREVLGYEFTDCLITDESDLHDFAAGTFGDRNADVESMLARLEAHYLIDARAAHSTRIVDVLEFLEARGVTG